MMLFSTSLFSQENTSKTKMPSIPDKEDMLIVSITSDNWEDLPSNIESKPFRSRGFAIHFMNEVMNKSGTFGLGGGLGFMSQNVHTDGIIIDTVENGAGSVLQPLPDSVDYNVNKLSLNFLTLSMEFRVRTKENSHGERFKLSAGMLAGILLQAHTKYSDDDQKYKQHKIKHLNDFQYGFTARVGYSNYALSGYYSMVEVFDNKKSTKLIPYSIGISFTF
jgi:hypothetical protein